MEVGEREIDRERERERERRETDDRGGREEREHVLIMLCT